MGKNLWCSLARGWGGCQSRGRHHGEENISYSCLVLYSDVLTPDLIAHHFTDGGTPALIWTQNVENFMSCCFAGSSHGEGDRCREVPRVQRIDTEGSEDGL